MKDWKAESFLYVALEWFRGEMRTRSEREREREEGEAGSGQTSRGRVICTYLDLDRRCR